MPHIAPRPALFVLLILLLLAAPTSVLRALAQESGATAAPVAPVPEPLPGIAEVVPRAAELLDQARQALQRVEEEADNQGWLDSFDASRQRQEQLQQRMTDMGDPAGWSYEQLLEMRTQLLEQRRVLAGLFDYVSQRTAELDQLRGHWNEQRDYWQQWRKQLRELGAPYPESEFKEVVSQSQALLKRITTVSQDKIALQKKATELIDANQVLVRQLDSALRTLRTQTFKKNSNSLLSRDFYAELTPELLQQVRTNSLQVNWKSRDSLRAGWWILLLQILTTLVLASLIRHFRHLAQQDSDWRFLICHPFSSGLFIAIVSLGFLYSAPTLVWRFYQVVLALLAACILLNDIVTARRHRLLIWLLASSYLLSLLLQVINLPLTLTRLYFVLLSIGGLLVLTQLYRQGRRQKDPWPLMTGLRIGKGLLLVSLVAQIGGYSTFSSRLMDISFKSAFALLVAVMLQKLVRGAIDFLLARRKLQSLPFFRRFGTTLGERLKVLVRLVIGFSCLIFLVQIWTGGDRFASTWQRVAGWGLHLGDYHLNIGTLASLVLIVYLTSGFSWLVRSLFDVEVVGPKFLDSGVRESIKTLLHYLTILVGLLLCLGALGVNLQNITVIAGALSIGIGFGLQNIVNNFISGLILLFERPIKKGDLIVLNQEWAEVKKIGLRSTVVETFNKAEIIVPNSDLIAQQVTNLTYSNTQARVVIPIGVAYGSDLEQVLRILQEEGARHPRVLKFPAPSALFIGFGASSLDFQLRLWLSSPDFVLSVPSDVCIAIYKRFAAEGIEIPFPQQDLHLRSVDSSLLQAWRSSPPVPDALQPAPPAQQEEQQQGEDQQQQTKG